MRDLVHGAFDRPERPSGRDSERSLTGRRRALRADLFSKLRHRVVVGIVYAIVGAVDGEAVVKVFKGVADTLSGPRPAS